MTVHDLRPGTAPVPPTGDARALDEGLLALPLFDDHHRDTARAAVAWAEAAQHLWAGSDPADAAAAGTRIRRALGADGWFGFLDPDAPGPGGDARSLCLVREALAHADDLADFAFSIQALAATPLLRHGSEGQRRRWLPGMASGETAGSFAVSEPDAGSDVAAVALAAERDGDGWVLSGRKAWIAAGDTADLHCVIARTGEGPGPLGLSAFLVPAGTPGLTAEPIGAIAPRSFAHLVFDGCRVGPDAVLGRPGRGYVVALDVLERFRMTVGAAALGFARRAAVAAGDRARSRTVGSGRLADLGTVRATLADMHGGIQSAALLVARAAWELDTGRRGFGVHSSLAKLHATETAQQVVDACVQIFGAAGLVAGSLPERLYRQVRSLRVYEGASEIQRSIIADSLTAPSAR